MGQAPPTLPYGRHWVDEDDVAAVAAVLRGGALTGGPAVAAFERALAEAVGARHAVSCASGTAALHLAVSALGLPRGTTALVPAMTFLATANAPRLAGMEVAFTDVDPDTGLVDEAGLRAALEGVRGAGVVLPIHLNGQTADTEAVAALAREHGLRVIEDACHALGASYRAGAGEAVRVGSCRHSDMAVFSFHPVKAVTMGEGGAVTTNDAALAERVRRLRNHGMLRAPARFTNTEAALDAEGQPNPWYYEMAELGFNYRASDIHCALGLSQLAKLERFVARRRHLAERYDRRLEPLAPVVRPVGRVAGCRPAWHLYPVRIDFPRAGRPRAALMRALGERGIGTQVHYIPVHRQPYYRRRYGEQTLPGAERYYQRALSLPLYPAMRDADVDRVVGALEACLEA